MTALFRDIKASGGGVCMARLTPRLEEDGRVRQAVAVVSPAFMQFSLSLLKHFQHETSAAIQNYAKIAPNAAAEICCIMLTIVKMLAKTAYRPLQCLVVSHFREHVSIRLSRKMLFA
jgi:hypothetical protein